jgi:hypothetical protein
VWRLPNNTHISPKALEGERDTSQGWVRREGVEPADAIERTEAIHERTWAELDRYRDRASQSLRRGDFVRDVLRHNSAVDERDLGDVKAIKESRRVTTRFSWRRRFFAEATVTQRVGWLSVASWRRAGWAGNPQYHTHRDGGAPQRRDGADPTGATLARPPGGSVRCPTIGSGLFRGPMVFVELHTNPPGDLFTMLDRMSMAVSLVARVPLQEWTLLIPDAVDGLAAGAVA